MVPYLTFLATRHQYGERGGYYGGGSSSDTGSGADGGSSFISGFQGCDTISEESKSQTKIIQSIHSSGIVFFATNNEEWKRSIHHSTGGIVITCTYIRDALL